MAVFVVTTGRGPAWNDSVGIREQLAFDDHAAFMDGLVARGVIVLGGPIESDDAADVALVAVQAESIGEVHELFADDPWICMKVFILKSIRAWTIWLDGRLDHDEHAKLL
jgi:uncharacterized protein YciI